MTAAPAAPHLRFATTRLATGPLIHYVEQGDPGGEALLFVHGWPDSWFSFSRVLGLLPTSFHAYALDLRGFGGSERPALGYTIDQLAIDLVSFMTSIGVARATLVGHSMGSFVVRRVAEIAPACVARLVLVGSAPHVANDVTREVQALLQTLADPLPVAFVREFQSSTIHLPVPEPFFEGIVAASLQAPARVWQRTFEGLLAFDDADHLGRIAAPTLLLWGDQDAVFAGEAGQRRLAAAIPRARLTILPETGHSPNWERPERFVAELEAFLRATPGRPAP
jgi:pimeloyl-ACP methyl ester carboxylesterase